MSTFKRVLRALLDDPKPATARPRLKASPRTMSNGQREQAGLSTIGQVGGAYFDALRPSGDRTQMTLLSLGAYRSGASSVERMLLSALSRSMYENGGYVGYAINQIANYSAPVSPQASSPDAKWNTAAEDWFAIWSKRADFLGRAEMDFNALQAIVSQACDIDGDIGAIITTDDGFPKLQIIEGWRIANGDKSNENTVDGVVLDKKGRVAGYEVASGDTTEFVPAGQMILLRDPSLVSPYRGLSPMRRGMNDLRDARDILGFEKLAVKHNASLIGVIEGEFVDDTQGFNMTAPGEDGDPDSPAEGTPAADATESQKALSRMDMLGGDIQVLEPGQKWQKAESNRPNAQFDSFVASLVSQFAAGLDIPPAFFLDSKLTGPNQRAVLGKAQRKFNQRIAVMCRLVEWVWQRVIGWAIANGELPAVDGWWRVEFQVPAKLSIDAGREAAQDRDDTGAGLMTRQEHYGARGKDWMRETDQSFAEHQYIIERAIKLANKTGVDVNTILSRYGYEPKPKAEQQGPNDVVEDPQADAEADPDGDPEKD